MTSILAPDEFTIKNGDPSYVWAALAEKLVPQDIDEEEERRREYARTHMIGYTQYTFPGYITDPFHEDVCNAIDRVVFDDHPDGHISHLMLFAPPQHGKQCAHETPILTTKGWKIHGDLQIGDHVFGRYGQPVKVVALSKDSMADFGVEFTDGAIIKCHSRHEWIVFERGGHRSVYRCLETGEIEANGVWMGERNTRGGRARYQIDENIAIEFEQQDLPIHPYILGVWLGDGTKNKNCITHSPKDYKIIDKIERLGIERTAFSIHPETGVFTSYFRRLYKLLKENELFDNKNIPEIYKCSSLDQRIELLAGLIDTDGYIYHKNGRTTISTADERLRDDIADLIRSLGWRATIVRYEPTTSSSGIVGRKPVYQISFNPTLDIPCALERKRPKKLNPKTKKRGIKAIRRCDPVPGRCIQVEGGIYLVGKTLIPTHNSEIVSTRLPGFWLAHHPELPVALTSYNQRLAYRNSRLSRAVVESPAYDRLFGGPEYGILRDLVNWRKKDWHILGHKGFVFSTGIEGDLTGEGFGLGIIDDPIKDWAAAQSEVVRENAWDWWRGTYTTRMWEHHRTVFMMTRWHEDDLAARIIDSEGTVEEGGKWDILAYSALAESQDERNKYAEEAGRPKGLPDPLGRFPLEPLAPSRYSAEYLLDVRDNVGSLVWGAEYQQHPTPPKGDYFKVGRIKIKAMYPIESFGGELIDRVPVGLKKCVRFWDLAASEKKKGKDPDYTSGTLLGIDREGFTWVLNQISLQASSDQVEQVILQTANLDGKKVKIRIEQEPGAAGKALCAAYVRKLAGYDVEGIPSSGDKQTRAYNFSAQVNAGNVRLLDASWNKIWLARHRTFPFGKHDDEIDSTSGAFNDLTGGKRWIRQTFKHL